MSRRDSDTVTMTVWLTVREGLILDEMRSMTAIDSNANLLRAALYFYAKHLEVEHLHFSDFGIRRKGREPHRANSQPKREPKPETIDSSTFTLKTSRAKRPRNQPAADHPWRRRLFA